MKTKALELLRGILLPALLAGLAYVAVAQQGEVQHSGDKLAAAQTQVANLLAGDRVIDLPEDGQAYYLTVFTNDQPSPKDRMLLAWLESDSVLASLKAQTHYNHYTPSVKMYQYRFGQAIPASEFPVLMLQGPDAQGNHGKVVTKVSNRSLPDSARKLAQMIRDALGPCPTPGPTPGPSPSPTPGPIPVVPDLGPSPNGTPNQPANDDQTTLLAVAAAIAAGLAGVVNEKRKTYGG